MNWSVRLKNIVNGRNEENEWNRERERKKMNTSGEREKKRWTILGQKWVKEDGVGYEMTGTCSLYTGIYVLEGKREGNGDFTWGNRKEYSITNPTIHNAQIYGNGETHTHTHTWESYRMCVCARGCGIESPTVTHPYRKLQLPAGIELVGQGKQGYLRMGITFSAPLAERSKCPLNYVTWRSCIFP